MKLRHFLFTGFLAMSGIAAMAAAEVTIREIEEMRFRYEPSFREGRRFFSDANPTGKSAVRYPR